MKYKLKILWGQLLYKNSKNSSVFNRHLVGYTVMQDTQGIGFGMPDNVYESTFSRTGYSYSKNVKHNTPSLVL